MSPSITDLQMICLIYLKRLKLTRFITTKESINKNAILSDKNAVKDVKGIVINDGKEVFNIAPFEQEVAK